MKIIAEIGWNHMGDIHLAEKMISAAVDAGANAVKFQYWNPKYLKKGAWDEDGRREIYKKAALNKEMVLKLISLSEKYKCEFLISVFGTNGAQDIFSLGQKTIKIPSHEIANSKLIQFCSNNFELVYLSTGASTRNEIESATRILNSGKADYVLMHCVSSYPVEVERANLTRINWLRKYNTQVGLSDHTMSTIVPALSVTYGVQVVEKHFTTDHDLPGRDNKFALEPKEFRKMVDNLVIAEKAIIDRGLDYQDIESDTVNNYRGRWEPYDYE